MGDFDLELPEAFVDEGVWLKKDHNHANWGIQFPLSRLGKGLATENGEKGRLQWRKPALANPEPAGSALGGRLGMMGELEGAEGRYGG